MFLKWLEMGKRYKLKQHNNKMLQIFFRTRNQYGFLFEPVRSFDLWWIRGRIIPWHHKALRIAKNRESAIITSENERDTKRWQGCKPGKQEFVRIEI